ncbi:hypothetical protein I302_106319 [Kwoniella bestiolae CBS 10118]|uniref:UBC core domain-containing protein n=1 Tax=Kwoniella bestiolae CBS 10118 TaxID=1296100 RepID=A0A1B9G3Q6_9TREE|nr:hypothetical protein I302_05443 [Kwoniella bestiolae CBS 10118]OCF25622.1 hypothetical protein I302_05443 [Kwoniella bestiolae CBS 10118]
MSSRKKRGQLQPSSSSSTTTAAQPTKRVTRSSTTKQQQPEASTSTSTVTTPAARPTKKRKVEMSAHQPIIVDDSDEEGEDTFFSGAEGEDFEIDDDIQAAISASLQDQVKSKANKVGLPSPALTEEVSFGRAGWKRDYGLCKSKWAVQGEIEGYAGMIGTVREFKLGDSDDSITFELAYDDIDGREFKFGLDIVFQDLKNYPASYKLVLFSPDALPRRADTTFSRFTEVYDLELPLLLGKILASLQGDDEATGGIPGDFVEGEQDEDEDEEMIDGADPWAEDPGRGFEIAKGSEGDLGAGWIQIKEHFQQAEEWGYRPGLTRVSDFWVVSYSIPLKNLPIDPNVLGMWDDGLVNAWKKDRRLTLMMGTDTYPPHLDKMNYWLGFHPNYKPPLDVMVSTTRGHGMPGFYLSAPILNYLKSFGRCYKLRTAFGLNWTTSDRIGMDEEETRQVFQYNQVSRSTGKEDKDDPIAKGFERNIPLVTFHWVLRRFMEAPKYCLNCGLEVNIPSLRPYVCDKPLCIYGFMSLGLGPSVEHTIVTHPAVVDVLVSFAHCAAASGPNTRMELPHHLHIEVPPEFGIPQPQLLDELSDPDQRRALAWLIEKLPRISEIKAHLESGGKLKSIEAPSGSIGVLRWLVGSCRAYLKETKPGEGVQDASSATSTTPSQAVYGGFGGDLKQFTFVVGSPEQESNFRNEIELAKKGNRNCVNYPTLLAFHGSGTERWHNILRTGLDFTDTINGRAYGNGVYFAPDSGTSMGSYSRGTPYIRENADFKLSKATALVELVNVPHTFASSHPYYVVNNVKQIKPFLLLVQGTNMMETSEEVEEERVRKAQSAKGALFVHDPMLRIKTTFGKNPLAVRMPEKLTRTTYIDGDANDETDQDIFNPPPPPPKPLVLFKPSPQSRYDRLEMLPPPTETSVVANKALGKELKAVVKAQEEGTLPFWVNPDVESLYCWILELHTFPPDSHLHKELKKHDISSIIAELRFPASFPHSPPFMRIIHPRMMPFMHGGGGNITGGGSVCNELMTGTGWNPAFCTEAVVREVMTNMTEATPPAKLDPRNWNSPYTMREAIEAYKRVASAHGWQIPRDFDKLTL